jgi:tetratricopeptide (TPR) repeat protein
MRTAADNLNSSSIPIARIESEARELARLEKWSEAARLLMRAARAEPCNTARWLQIAQWQRQSREPRAAAKTLRDALRLNGLDAPQRSPRSEGERERRKAMGTQTGPQLGTQDSVSIWQALAETQLEAQSWDECIAACRSLLQLAPNHHYGQELLATALLHAGRVDEAAEVMRRLLMLSPRDPLHRIKLGTLFQLQGRSGDALREFQRVIDAYPDAPFSAEAHEAIEVLDRMQIQQVLMRATEDDDFRLRLQRDTEEVLQENNFYLSEGGLESLRHLLWDGSPTEAPAPIRIH